MKTHFKQRTKAKKGSGDQNLVSSAQPPKKKNSSLGKAIHQNLRGHERDIKAQIVEANVSWDDLNKLNTDLKQIIGKFVADITPIVTNPDVVRSLPDEEKGLYNTLCTTITRDIDELLDRMELIHAKHKDLNGRIDSIEEYGRYMEHSMAYDGLYQLTISKMEPLLAELMTSIEKHYPTNKETTDPINIIESETQSSSKEQEK